MLFAIRPTLLSGLYAIPPEWWERVKSCLVLSVSVPPVLTYNTSLVIDDQFGATPVWNVPAIELLIHALMLIFVFAKRRVGYGCYDPPIGHSDCGAITPLLGGAKRCIDHCGFPQFVVGCVFYISVDYLVNQRSPEIE